MAMNGLKTLDLGVPYPCTASNIVINGAALVFVTFVGLITHDQFRDYKQIHRGLKISHYAACISSSVASIGGIGQNVLCMVLGIGMEWLMAITCFVGYVSLLQCVLGVFILRLYTTFLDSPLQLSAVKRVVLGATYLAMVIMWSMQIVVTIYIVFVQRRFTENAFVFPLWLWSVMLLTLFLFVVLSLWTVYEFCHKVLLTAKLRSNWTRTTGLDKKQCEIINVSFKYLSLFLLAASTTLIHFGVFSFCLYHELDPSILVGIDCMVNVLCLSLQFPFTAVFYYRYCRRLDICCRWTMTWSIGKHDEAVKARRALMNVPRTSTVDERNIAKNLEETGTGSNSDIETGPPRDLTANGREKAKDREITAFGSNKSNSMHSLRVINEEALAQHILMRISSNTMTPMRSPDRVSSPFSLTVADGRQEPGLPGEERESETTTTSATASSSKMMKLRDAASSGSSSETTASSAFGSGDEAVSCDAIGSVPRPTINVAIPSALQDEPEEEESTWNVSNTHGYAHKPVPHPEAEVSPTSTVHSEEWHSTQL
jgi:hypothetical protein